MAIQFNEESKVFTIHTEHSTYQMIVADYGFLCHLYYGKKIEKDEMTDFILGIDRGFSGNPYEAGNDRTFSLDCLPQEYSAFGTGDYRSSCLQVINSDGSFDVDLRYHSHVIYEGKPKLEGLPAVYGSEEVKTLEITLKDQVTNLAIILSYSDFEKYDVITRSVRAVNNSSDKIVLDKILSCCLDFTHKNEMDYITFYGKHAMERQLERTNIRHGKTTIESVRGCSSHQHNPFVILCDTNAGEEHGDCYGMSLVYSGNFIAEAELDQTNQIRATMGISSTGFSFVLRSEESFQAPEVVLSYSEMGLSKLSDNFHTLYRNHLCRGKYKNIRRPILINNWEATYFDFDDAKLIQIAKEASKLGIEMLVMDDGWFGKRDGDLSGLGDWYVNSTKLKGGLASVCEKVNMLGMKFGIWFEPEMISEESDLYRIHPDWCLKTPSRQGIRSRYQFILDMTREEIRDYLYYSIAGILDSANIEYVKWDMNRHLANVYSSALPYDRQGEVYHRYVLGVYDLLERLTTKYPNVLFEGCSGGGGRFDAGMLYYTPQIWCSDNTDPIERIKIQYGTSFGYPISAVGAHVSASPNHQTSRTTPLNTRAVVAMSGTFGYELDISKMTEEEKDIIKEQIITYKENYDLISYGTYYRLTNPYKNDRYVAWEYVSEDKKEALVSFVLLKPEANPPFIILQISGLLENYQYQVNGDKIYSGAALRNAGYRMPVMYGDYTAIQLKLNCVD